MLVLTRKTGSCFYIQSGKLKIKVYVLQVKGRQVRIGVEAPSGVGVYREELLNRYGNGILKKRGWE